MGTAPDPPDLRKLAQDWLTLWQSELAALAVDREAQETWHAVLSLWAAATAQATGVEHPDRRAGAAAAPGAAPAAAAPDARDAALDRLSRRVADLEARLAELERGDPGPAARRTGAERLRGPARRRPGRDAAP